MMEALVWPQRRSYKKITVECSIDQNCAPGQRIMHLRGTADRFRGVSRLRTTPAAAAQGLKRIFDNALAGAVHGFLVRRRNRGVSGRRRRHGGADLALFQGS